MYCFKMNLRTLKLLLCTVLNITAIGVHLELQCKLCLHYRTGLDIPIKVCIVFITEQTYEIW